MFLWEPHHSAPGRNGMLRRIVADPQRFYFCTCCARTGRTRSFSLGPGLRRSARRGLQAEKSGLYQA